jgi:ubiquinone biosynthesis monooxygenase Coq7
METLRLAFPPHDGKGIERGLRLACQCTVMPGAQIKVAKHEGFWGQKPSGVRSFAAVGAGGVTDASPQFDFEAIRRMKPFPHWLQQEMRSNHAGETGAVMIYSGAAFALGLRLRIRQLLGQGSSYTPYEAELAAFVEEHQESEREHLVLLNRVLETNERSIILPGWTLAGFALGAASTLWCARGMYLTTEAVETFVEEHYEYQIGQLDGEIEKLAEGARVERVEAEAMRGAAADEVRMTGAAAGAGAGAVAAAAAAGVSSGASASTGDIGDTNVAGGNTNVTGDTGADPPVFTDMGDISGGDVAVQLHGRQELRAMLRHCCEDEVSAQLNYY